MKILANGKIRALLYKILLYITVFSVFSAIVTGLSLKQAALYIWISALGMGILILAACYGYFKEQNGIMEHAVEQIKEYISGNKDARIECYEEGELYRLFHEVNSLVSILNAHIENEGKEKEFLRNTISDISHQLKTPLAALNIYNGIMQGEADNPPAVKEFAQLAESDVIFTDERETTEQTNTTYLTVRIGAYGFLVIIGMVTMFYIINSISISVAARTKQYGAMRAVGMDSGQLTRMIMAEAFTYAISGLAAGIGIGIPFSYLLHTLLIARYFGAMWHPPVVMLCLIIVFVVVCVAVAVYAPAKRIRNMAITDTINEL